MSSKFTPPGGEIRVSLKRQPDRLDLIVKDTGRGIAAEHLPHVFDRFYRADPSRSSEGVGLGLALVKSIMDLHGGSVTAESKPGEGTIITLRFIQSEQMSRSDQHRTNLQPLV